MNSKLKILSLVAGCCWLVAVSGCQQSQQHAAKIPIQSELILIGTDTFPEQLAGRWMDDRLRWDIVIEKDGRISEIIHTTGRVKVRAGEITAVPLIQGGEGMMQPGEWVLQFDADTREMVISIDIDKMRFQVGPQIVEGSCRDIFFGPVYADGNTWVAQWNTYPTYFITTTDYERHELPMDEILQDLGTITFKRVDE